MVIHDNGDYKAEKYCTKAHDASAACTMGLPSLAVGFAESESSSMATETEPS